MTTPGACSLAILLALCAACTSLAGFDVQYDECVLPKIPYLDQFDEDDQSLLDRCWRSQNVQGENLGERRLLVGEDDLILGYANAQTKEVPWHGDPPMLLRGVEGDFVLATRAEVTSGSQSNFCGLDAGDAAGIVIEGAGERATFLVQPFYANPATKSVDCLDNAADPPTAKAEAHSSDKLEPTRVEGIGIDGEADIAVCRLGSELNYYYRAPADAENPWTPEDWKVLPNRDGENIGNGPVDVGLTTTLGAHPYDLYVQGHFNWVALLHEGTLEDCQGPLEDFHEPAGD